MTKLKIVLISVCIVFLSLLYMIRMYRADEYKYEAFLENKVGARYQNTEYKKLEDLFKEETHIEYLYVDIKGDQARELHIRSEKSYYIIEEYEGDFWVIYEGTAYEYPVINDEWRGVLYYREGSAPHHDIYYATIFDNNGAIVQTSEYSWYDVNEDWIMDSEDLYLVNKDEWDIETWKKATRIYRESERITEGWIEIAGVIVYKNMH